MEILKQVITFSQAKKLHALGVKQDSAFYYFPNPNTEEIKKTYGIQDYQIHYGGEYLHKQSHPIRYFVLSGEFQKTYSAFTVAELGQMLPNDREVLEDGFKFDSYYNTLEKSWYCVFEKWNDNGEGNWATVTTFLGNTEAEVRASMLICLIETKNISVEECNRLLQL